MNSKKTTIEKVHNSESDEDEYYKVYRRPYLTYKTLNDPKFHIYARLRCNSVGKLLNSDGTDKIKKVRKVRVCKPRNGLIRKDKGKHHNYPKVRKERNSV